MISHASKDLFRGTSAFFLWWLPAAILVTLAFANGPLLAVIWPVLLTWMGVTCLINARRCGRRHCYVTGPFFLVMAGVSALYGLRLLPLGPNGWKTLAIVLLVGACVLCCLPEMLWGKYLPSRQDQS